MYIHFYLFNLFSLFSPLQFINVNFIQSIQSIPSTSVHKCEVQSKENVKKSAKYIVRIHPVQQDVKGTKKKGAKTASWTWEIASVAS